MFAYFFPQKKKKSKERDHLILQIFILDHHWKISRFCLDLQVLQELVESVPAQVHAVIRAKGGDIREIHVHFSQLLSCYCRL